MFGHSWQKTVRVIVMLGVATARVQTEPQYPVPVRLTRPAVSYPPISMFLLCIVFASTMQTGQVTLDFAGRRSLRLCVTIFSMSHGWCQQQICLTVCGPSGQRTHVVQQPYARIGSHPHADLVLAAGPGVPPRCGYLHATEEGIYWVDFRGGSSGRNRGWVGESDTIQIGPYQVSARLAHPPRSGPPCMADLQRKHSASAACPVLHVLLNERLVARVRLRRQLTVVGHRQLSTLRIINQHVSAFHCVLYREEDQIWVVDLMSRNRSRVDGRPVQVARLPVGSHLALHKIRLQYVGVLDGLSVVESIASSSDSDIPLHVTAVAAGSTGGVSGRRPDSRMEGQHQIATSSISQTPHTHIKPRDEQNRQLGAACRGLEESRQAWEQERREMLQALKADRAEIASLRQLLRDEQLRWQAAIVDRERELEEASAAVQRAVRSLESQRMDFDQRHRAQAEQVDQQRVNLEERLQVLTLSFQQREALFSQRETRLADALRDLERSRRHFRRQQSAWAQQCRYRLRQLAGTDRVPAARDGEALNGRNHSARVAGPAGTGQEQLAASCSVGLSAQTDAILQPAGDDRTDRQLGAAATAVETISPLATRHMPPWLVADDRARVEADRLSLEVCDRLVRRQGLLVRHMRLIMVGTLLLIAAAALGGLCLFGELPSGLLGWR